MICIKNEVSIFIASLINTIHCLNISFKENESLDIIKTINTSSSSNDSDRYLENITIILPTHQKLLLEYCMCISAICLTMHLIVYAFVPKLRNTPGKCLMSLSLSLLLAKIVFLISFHIEASPQSIFCVSVALIRFYTFLASFFWMNVIAYDVYKTFAKPNSGFKNKSYFKSSKRVNQNYNFLVYSLYAWSLPAIIVLISFSVQVNIPFDSPYNPAFGKTICGISHFKAMLIFFMFPVSALLTSNVILFIITARKLKLTANETRFATKSTTKYRLVLHIKLVMVLGITYIIWFIAVFTRIPLFIYPSILLHGLQGVYIFVAFTVKKNVHRMILSRIKYLCGDQQIRFSKIRLKNNIITQPYRKNASFPSTDHTLIILKSNHFRHRSSSI